MCHGVYACGCLHCPANHLWERVRLNLHTASVYAVAVSILAPSRSTWTRGLGARWIRVLLEGCCWWLHDLPLHPARHHPAAFLRPCSLAFDGPGPMLPFAGSLMRRLVVGLGPPLVRGALNPPFEPPGTGWGPTRPPAIPRPLRPLFPHAAESLCSGVRVMNGQCVQWTGLGRGCTIFPCTQPGTTPQLFCDLVRWLSTGRGPCFHLPAP